MLPAALGAALLPGCMSADMVPLVDTRVKAQPAKPTVTPAMPAADREAFDEGVALATQLRYVEAQDRFQRVLRWFQALGDAPMAAETLFWLGYCSEKQGRTAQAWDYYDRLLKLYPTTPAAAQATRRRAALPPIGGEPPPLRPPPVLRPLPGPATTQPTSRPA